MGLYLSKQTFSDCQSISASANKTLDIERTLLCQRGERERERERERVGEREWVRERESG